MSPASASAVPANAAGAQPELAAILHAGFAVDPCRAAVIEGSRVLDYAGMLESVERLASGLSAAGMRPDDVVAFTAQRDLQTLQLLVAILLAGGACLPLDANYPPARLADMLADARPGWLVTPEHSRMPFADVEGMRHCSVDALLSASGTASGARSLLPSGGELAYVLFTSGSSGRPKGVAMPSAVLARLTAWHVAHPRLGHAACTLQFAPLGFDVCFQEICSTFAAGGTLVLPSDAERRDPFALLALLERHRVERLFLPYVALQALAEAVAAGGVFPSGLRDVISAGEQLRVTPAIRALFKGLPGSILHNHYGPTETHVVTAFELSGDPEAWPELPPIGRPLPHVRVRVADAQGREVAAREEGELLLGGDCLAAGYIRQPERTAERFVGIDGARWYRSGDGVCERTDGMLEYLGRLDAQIKIDGYRVEPAEIEAVLCRHAEVAEAVVVAAGPEQGKRLIAHVVPRNPERDDAELVRELAAHCRSVLADYLVPHMIRVRPALPLTASGKIDRRMLAAEEDHADAGWKWPASGGGLQEQLRSLWQHLLDIEALDVHANVFDLGARSLTVVRAITELHAHGFRNLSAARIYEYPSVEKLAAFLQSGDGVESDAAGDARTRGEHQRAALARFGPRARGRP